MRWKLLDVEARKREEPRRFPIPRRDERAAIAPGDLVKLVFLIEDAGPEAEWSGERMWVEVERAGDGEFVGRLHNEPKLIDALHAGDAINFAVQHVAALLVEPIDAEASAIVSRRVLDEDAWPRRLFREPEQGGYSGWQVLVGDEPPGWFSDPANARLVRVGDLLDLFPVLESIFAESEVAEWRWDPDALEYRRS